MLRMSKGRSRAASSSVHYTDRVRTPRCAARRICTQTRARASSSVADKAFKKVKNTIRPFVPSIGVLTFLSLVFLPSVVRLLDRVPALATLEQYIGFFALVYAIPSNFLFAGQRQRIRFTVANFASRLSGQQYSLASDDDELDQEIRSQVQAIMADSGAYREAVAQSLVQYIFSAKDTALSDVQACFKLY